MMLSDLLEPYQLRMGKFGDLARRQHISACELECGWNLPLDPAFASPAAISGVLLKKSHSRIRFCAIGSLGTLTGADVR